MSVLDALGSDGVEDGGGDHRRGDRRFDGRGIGHKSGYLVQANRTALTGITVGTDTNGNRSNITDVARGLGVERVLIEQRMRFIRTGNCIRCMGRCRRGAGLDVLGLAEALEVANQHVDGGHGEVAGDV